MQAHGEPAWAFGTHAAVGSTLCAADIARIQLACLNETLAHARAYSAYYRQRLPKAPLASLEELAALPLMDASVLRGGMAATLCASPAEISRIVTLPTSGTTGAEKRIAFTARDQQATLEYFAAGMRMLQKAESAGGAGGTCNPAIAVLFPCERSGGLGHLLLGACRMAGAEPLPLGIPASLGQFAAACNGHDVQGIVGFPQHLLALARLCDYADIQLAPTAVLLSADNVAPALRDAVAGIWNCEVFEHYGMTETGYGAAVDCPCHNGLHVRETQLVAEVVDPISGAVLLDGHVGELVVTTLGREAMPLIRYRTGDYTSILPDPCPCGSSLRRIAPVQARLAGDARLGTSLTMPSLEQALFAIPGILDFQASWRERDAELSLSVQCLPPQAHGADAAIQAALQEVRQAVRPLLPPVSSTRVSVQPTSDFKPYSPAKRLLRRV